MTRICKNCRFHKPGTIALGWCTVKKEKRGAFQEACAVIVGRPRKKKPIFVNIWNFLENKPSRYIRQ